MPEVIVAKIDFDSGSSLKETLFFNSDDGGTLTFQGLSNGQLMAVSSSPDTASSIIDATRKKKDCPLMRIYGTTKRPTWCPSRTGHAPYKSLAKLEKHKQKYD